MSDQRTASCRAAFLAVAAFVTAPAFAEDAVPSPASGLDITIFAERIPTAIQRTGSAVTILKAEDIARANPLSLADALRQVPGLDITETGGPGSSAVIRLRGANAGQTLVLIDGIRINDPASASGEFNASLIAPALIERIEVLRGPQSALHGSDAMGGVINIVTRRGGGAPRYSLTTEGGSYGSLSTSGAASGSAGAWSYAASGLAQKSNGFSRYGYRIGRLTPAHGGYESDGLSRLAGFGRLGYDPGTGFRLDLSATAHQTRADYDAAFGSTPDSSSRLRQTFSQVAAKAELDTLDGRLTHGLQIFANRTDRRYFDVHPGFGSSSRSDFIGDRLGAEYQGLIRLAPFGTLILGGRYEQERVALFSQNYAPTAAARAKTLGAEQQTRALFALWQVPVGERLTVSLGGRYDSVAGIDAFPTWRTTLAYRILETGTKLRASAGTGAKAPTLYQLRSPDYGTPTLAPEHSFGVDAGFDQSLFEGRATGSVTVFANRFRNMIDFAAGSHCRPSQTFGCYLNVARASTSGIETALDIDIAPERLRLRTTYTYLHAKDRKTNLTLARRAPHFGRVALQITPFTGLLIEPALLLSSERFSSTGERNRLAPYARLDIRAEYALSTTYRLHGRIENLTNARYQEVFNYGTTGRAYYAGLNATW
ncbi:MAG: TonB-dependent receptor [Hyphomicrobiales bacterium]|nr:TonB-dependent receptor [Hyphomicrobiales bacterium]